EARRAIGDEAKQVIVTVHARGFRLAVPVARGSALAPRPETQGPRPTASMASLVGRAACLSASATAIERAQAGGGRLLFLSGERGMGKSSVLAKIGRQAEANGATVRAAHARHGMDAPPFWLWKEALPDLDAAFSHLSTGRGGAARFSLLEG